MAVSGSRSGRMTELQLTKLWREQVSPERSKVWTTEPAPNGKSLKPDDRVAVVYYLSRNGQLQHPHFMEVPLSSPHGLFLTDVISRLNVLRGKGMAAMYSWSCKRSYKNGFVWHDLSENDFIYPAHGHEYVLKGSELPPAENTFLDTVTPLRKQQPAPENQITGVGHRRNQSCSSVDFNLHEYSVYKAEPSSDASTQTDDQRRHRQRRPTQIVPQENKSNQPPQPRDEIEIEITPPPSDSSPETLETLMKADRRLVQESTAPNVNQTRQSKSSVLMQLISCGSISFKDCGPGHVGLGLMRLPRGGGRRLKLEEKDYFSGSLVETKKEEFVPTLKRSTSYNADR